MIILKGSNILIYKIFFLFITFFIIGCANISPQQQLNHEANTAFKQNKYNIAKEKYKTALNEAKLKNDLQYEAISMYGLGRSYGYLCKYKKAEKWLIKSITLRKSIPDTNIAYLSQNILELARLYKSGNEFTKANSEYAKAIPLLESLNIQTRDPIGYVNVLEKYALTLKKSGNITKSIHIKKIINNLWATNPNKQTKFVETSYPSGCNK